MLLSTKHPKAFPSWSRPWAWKTRLLNSDNVLFSWCRSQKYASIGNLFATIHVFSRIPRINSSNMWSSLFPHLTFQRAHSRAPNTAERLPTSQLEFKLLECGLKWIRARRRNRTRTRRYFCNQLRARFVNKGCGAVVSPRFKQEEVLLSIVSR